jgi:hypothetical protein
VLSYSNNALTATIDSLFTSKQFTKVETVIVRCDTTLADVDSCTVFAEAVSTPVKVSVAVDGSASGFAGVTLTSKIYPRHRGLAAIAGPAKVKIDCTSADAKPGYFVVPGAGVGTLSAKRAKGNFARVLRRAQNNGLIPCWIYVSANDSL